MRRSLTTLILTLLIIHTQAQSFSGTGGAITNNGVPTPFIINIGSLNPPSLNSSFGLEEICIDITHPDMNEITVSLTSPSGQVVELVNSTTLKGGNFTSTCFRSNASASIGSSTGPYTGTFKPTGYIGRFNNGSTGSGNWTLHIKDYFTNGNSGTLNSWSLKFGTAPPPPVNFTSSNLPLVFITTPNNQPVTTNTMLIDFGIVDNVTSRNNTTDPRNGHWGKATINIRGSSSQIFEKKAFKIELRDQTGAVAIDSPILSMPAESDWVLTPSYSDKTLMRNGLTQELFRQMGHYSPRSRYVELFINNEYFGVYTLLEKPKQHFNRIDVPDMSSMDNTYPNITGGYVVQINRFDPLPNAGWYSKFNGHLSTHKFFYQQEYPKPEEITQAQKDYLKAVLDSFETVMDGPNFNDPVTGYKKYIDVESFIDYFIITELSKNIDGYKLSTYMYKEHVANGGKFHMGPVWDFDIAWHNANYGNADVEQWWNYDQPNMENPIPAWWVKLMSDQEFKDKLYCRYKTLRLGVLSNGFIHAKIDKDVAELSEAQVRNFTQFPILDSYIFPNPAAQIGTSYQAMVDDLKSWVTKRGGWMDANIPGFCNNVALEESLSESNPVNVFPNPFEGDFKIMYSVPRSTNVHLSLTNILGEKVLETAIHREPGVFTEDLETGDLAYGTYLLKITVGNSTQYKKVIKTNLQ